MKLGLHIIKAPSGRFIYVGDVPQELCERVKATKSDVLGGRAVTEGKETVTYRPKAFNSYAESERFARSKGFAVTESRKKNPDSKPQIFVNYGDETLYWTGREWTHRKRDARVYRLSDDAAFEMQEKLARQFPYGGIDTIEVKADEIFGKSRKKNPKKKVRTKSKRNPVENELAFFIVARAYNRKLMFWDGKGFTTDRSKAALYSQSAANRLAQRAADMNTKNPVAVIREDVPTAKIETFVTARVSR